MNKKITDKKRLDFLSSNNMLTNFRKSIDSIIDFHENPDYDGDKLEKLIKKKVRYKGGNTVKTSNNVFEIEVHYKAGYIDTTEFGYVFYLPTYDDWNENSFVYIPNVGIGKEGSSPMWCSFLELLYDGDVKKIVI